MNLLPSDVVVADGIAEGVGHIRAIQHGHDPLDVTVFLNGDPLEEDSSPRLMKGHRHYYTVRGTLTLRHPNGPRVVQPHDPPKGVPVFNSRPLLACDLATPHGGSRPDGMRGRARLLSRHRFAWAARRRERRLTQAITARDLERLLERANDDPPGDEMSSLIPWWATCVHAIEDPKLGWCVVAREIGPERG